MFIITKKEDNEILMMGMELDYMENGYPRLVDYDVAFYPEYIDVHEVSEVVEGVEIHKYCYTEEDGFYPNPNYVEPNNSYGLPNDLYDTIRDEAVAQIEREVSGDADK